MGVRSLNNALSSFGYKFGRTGFEAVNPAPIPKSGLVASGGIISDYVVSGTYYRAHVFTGTGLFTVTDEGTGDYPTTVEYLVVAGGGGGGARGGGNGGGGGGAGGLRTNLSGHPLAGAAFPVSTSPGQYTATVGGGGVGAREATGIVVTDGADSVFGPITSTGGGHGGGHHTVPTPKSFAQPGGSGGGGGGATPYAGGNGNDPPSSPPQGNGGGPGYNGDPYVGGGGGGAGGAGQPGEDGANGGNGSEVIIAEPPATPAPQRTIGDNGVFAGGGGGGSFPSPDAAGTGGPGGGGNGGPAGGAGSSGDTSTGGGGGGGGANNGGGQGGSGVVVVRYQIDVSQSGTSKATGGNISFYNGKTIHAFTSTGDFNNTSGANLTGCEVVILGGGGGGGQWQGGGGGAGRFYRNDDVTISPGPQTVTIGAGGRGANAGPNAGAVGSTGSASVFNSVTMPGGGGGGHYGVPASAGGSGGGASYGPPSNPGAAPPGDVVAVVDTDTPADGAGNPGGAGVGNPQGSSGGGGAGGAGGTGLDPGKVGGPGGLGVKLPSTFQDPLSTIGFNSGAGGDISLYFVAGGGGGGAGSPATTASGGGGGAPRIPGAKAGTGMPANEVTTYEWAGAGSGTADLGPHARSARANSGSGGGGSGNGYSDNAQYGGDGGSGLVLIAYPT